MVNAHGGAGNGRLFLFSLVKRWRDLHDEKQWSGLLTNKYLLYSHLSNDGVGILKEKYSNHQRSKSSD